MTYVPRDMAYGRAMAWGPIYRRHFPHRTDPTSRHAKLISTIMRDQDSAFRKLLHDAGYEPDHMAEALELTVKWLWEAREEIERLRALTEKG